MDWSILSLLPLCVGMVLFFAAFRAHERFWALGFFGWQKVYAGLVFYLFSGLLSAGWYWVSRSSPGSAALDLLLAGSLVLGAGGVMLVLAGSIERLRELSAERARLEDIRAGFDLFDSLREIIAQPYAFLEVLDYALKEMVRAAGVESGGLWLYNTAKSEWVLTGWANMPEKLRQQTESIKGAGTGFDRLAAAHKVRLFTGTDKIRVFFPEWDAEGYQSILGLPLASGAIGTAGRQMLGAIILADRDPQRFDDDRARRLYAASDYVAAVIAEGRIIRQLDSARNQLDAVHAELSRERDEVRRVKDDAAAELARVTADSAAEIESVRAETAEQMSAMRSDLEKRLAAESERVDQFRQRWEEARTTLAELESKVTSERAQWEERLDRVRRDAQTERDAARSREQDLIAKHQNAMVLAERRNAELEHTLDSERRAHAEAVDSLKAARETINGREAEIQKIQRALTDERRRIGELESGVSAAREDLARQRAALAAAEDLAATIEVELTDTREAHAAEIADLTAQMESDAKAADGRIRHLEREIASLRLLVETRDAQIAARHEAEREVRAEAEHARDLLVAERKTAAEDRAALEVEIQAERERRATLLHEIQSLQDMIAQSNNQHQRMLADLRIEHRREVHHHEFRTAAMADRLGQILAAPSPEERLALTLRALAGRLPAPAQLYLWKRSPAGEPSMVAWLDAAHRLHRGERIAPWAFEGATIPAEGPTILGDAVHWNAAEERESERHRREWRQLWDVDESPAWAAAWPWGRSAHESNGWVTAFGFSAVPPADSHIEEAAMWTELVGAACLAITATDSDGATPQPGTIDSSGSSGESEYDTPTQPESGRPHEEGGHMTDSGQSELHNVILNWAASQTEDALRLDLSAPPGTPVYPVVAGWLQRTLEHGRSLCRVNGENPAEFIVTTTRKNGHVVLRFLRSSEQSDEPAAGISAVDDSDLCLSAAGETPSDAPVSGRWLLHDGSRIGMELRFDVPKDSSGPQHDATGDAPSGSPRVLIVEQQQAMAELLGGMIGSLGYDSETSSKPGAKADLAIVDVSSDTPDPWAPARELREQNPDLRILLLIGADTSDLPDDLPGDRLLRIPFQIEELQESLEALRSVSVST